MPRLVLLLAAALLLAGRHSARAQTPWALKATPQHLVLSGYWLEAERPRPNHPHQTLTLAPQLYWGPTGHPDTPRTPTDASYGARVRGGGLQVQQRFYLRPTATSQGLPTGPYVGYGPQVQVFQLRFERLGWHEEPGPNDVPYYVLGPQLYTETVLRYGVAAQVGYQWQLGSRALLDVYVGLGVRKSHYWPNLADSQFRSGPSDYAHEGGYVPAGFKLGVVL